LSLSLPCILPFSRQPVIHFRAFEIDSQNPIPAAVVVFPGGGYWILAIDLEGTEVYDWLTAERKNTW